MSNPVEVGSWVDLTEPQEWVSEGEERLTLSEPGTLLMYG